MKRKRDLDREVARLLDLRQGRVSLITACFLRTALHEIVDNGGVIIDGFGNFKLSEQKHVSVKHLQKNVFRKKGKRKELPQRTRRKFRVWFKKSAKFRQALEDAYGMEDNMSNDEGMDKYAVDEGVDQEKLEKKANQGCPECGQKPTRHGKTLICPKCGTQPFENTSK